LAHIYTRTGDDGTTFCAALKRRVGKDHPLIELVGQLDEANSFVGLARSLLPKELEEVNGDLQYVQRLLFRVGFTVSGKPSLSEDDVRRLEDMADRYYGRAPLKSFILPSGPSPAAALHVARTVTRRAERAMVRAAKEHPIDPLVAQGHEQAQQRPLRYGRVRLKGHGLPGGARVRWYYVQR